MKTITVSIQVSGYEDARLILDGLVDAYNQTGDGIAWYDIHADLDDLLNSDDDDDVAEAQRRIDELRD